MLKKILLITYEYPPLGGDLATIFAKEIHKQATPVRPKQTRRFVV